MAPGRLTRRTNAWSSRRKAEWIKGWHNMKTLRLGTHSLVLVVVDMIGIGVGAVAAYRMTGVPNQVRWQLPIAVILSIGFFVAWIHFLRAFDFQQMRPVEPGERWACCALSILWGPLVFVPLHYLTQGYLSDTGNLVAFALYQLPVNALALSVSVDRRNLRADGHTQLA
jgi:hypothetical protein